MLPVTTSEHCTEDTHNSLVSLCKQSKKKVAARQPMLLLPTHTDTRVCVRPTSGSPFLPLTLSPLSSPASQKSHHHHHRSAYVLSAGRSSESESEPVIYCYFYTTSTSIEVQVAAADNGRCSRRSITLGNLPRLLYKLYTCCLYWFLAFGTRQ